VRAVFVAIHAAAKHITAGGRVIDIGSCNADWMPTPGGGGRATVDACGLQGKAGR